MLDFTGRKLRAGLNKTFSAQDALNQLEEKHLELTYGDDGYAKLQGKQVVDRGITKEYPEKIKQITEGLSAKISSQAGRAKFMSAAGRANIGFNRGVLTHSAGQIEKMQDDAFTGAVKNAQTLAAIEGPHAAVSSILPVLETTIVRRGLAPEAADALRKDVLGGAYAAGINGLLKSDRSVEAQAVLEDAKPWMTAAQIEHFGGVVKSKRDWEVGNDLAKEAEALRASGKTAKEVESWLADKTKNNKEAYAAAQTVWTQLQQATREAAQEQQGAFNKQFWLRPTRATMTSIMSSTEFLSLPKSAQGTITEHMVKGLEHEDAVARARRSEAFSTPQAFSTFLNVMSSTDLARMPEDGIWGLAPVIGPQNVMRILAEQKSQLSGTARFHIDPKIVQDAMPPGIVTGPANKDKRDAFNGIIAVELRDWKTNNPGKTPTEQEQSAIIRRASQEYTINRKYWFDTTVKAYELLPMPAEFEAQATAALRARRRPVTPEALREAWAQQPGARK